MFNNNISGNPVASRGIDLLIDNNLLRFLSACFVKEGKTLLVLGQDLIPFLGPMVRTSFQKKVPRSCSVKHKHICFADSFGRPVIQVKMVVLS